MEETKDLILELLQLINKLKRTSNFDDDISIWVTCNECDNSWHENIYIGDELHEARQLTEIHVIEDWLIDKIGYVKLYGPFNS